MIDIGPKFYAVPSHPLTWPQGQGHRLRSFMLKFCVKCFKASLFPNHMIDLIYILYDDRYWSKILCSTIPTPSHGLKVKVTDLEFLCLSFAFKFVRLHHFQII